MRSRIIISWHRFYDPDTGRYITADPIGLAGGMNLYAYVGGNPVNVIDPKGLNPLDGSSEVDIEQAVNDAITAIDLARRGVCNPCLQVFSMSRSKCQCVFGAWPNIDGVVDCLCWDSPYPKRCKEKAKELLSEKTT